MLFFKINRVYTAFLKENFREEAFLFKQIVYLQSQKYKISL